MAESSVISIYKCLARLAIPAMLREIPAMLKNIEIGTIDFQQATNREGEWNLITAEAFSRCRVIDGVTFTVSESDTGTEFPMPAVMHAWLKEFAKANFGVDKAVKTRNVHLSVILEGKKRSKHETVQSFSDWMLSERLDDLRPVLDIIHETAHRLHAEFKRRAALLDEQRKDRLIEWARRDIRKVIMNYRGVDEVEIGRAILETQIIQVIDF